MNDTVPVPVPAVGWIGSNTSPDKAGKNNAGISGDFFDDPDRKPPKGFGAAGDMVYMLPLFTLMDRLADTNTSVPIISWPLEKGQEKGQEKIGVSEEGRASIANSQPESYNALTPTELPRRRGDEKIPPEGNEEHIHIGQGKKCPALGCNDGPCRCPECEVMSIQTTGKKRHLETLSEAISAKRDKLSTADELSPEVAENTGKAQEQGRVRTNSPDGTSTNIVHALTRRGATGARLSSLLDPALYSQYLLQATGPIQPTAVLNNNEFMAHLVSLCDTRFITWTTDSSSFKIWTEEISEWTGVVRTMQSGRLLVIKAVSCDRFFTWTRSWQDGSIRLWTEALGEWSDIEIATQRGANHHSDLLVLPDGELVVSTEEHLSVLSEVDGVWSSIELDIGSERIVKVIALLKGSFLTLSHKYSSCRVRLWSREEEGWTHEICFETTGWGWRWVNREVQVMDGDRIEDISKFSDGSFFILIVDAKHSGRDSETARRHIWSSRNERLVKLNSWEREDPHGDEYELLTSGQIITLKAIGVYPRNYIVSLWTEQSDGEWLPCEIISGMLFVSSRLLLRDERLVINSPSISEVLINNNGKWRSVSLEIKSTHPEMPYLFEIRAGLLATIHYGKTIRLWDLYHPSQCSSDQGASD